ncbi:MAG: nuclear transport factor 2 family protein [Pseudomonadales bacterium]|nr:nuclear transport factor 2 family protein [Pseudomonadales bacterium]MBO7005514.1 nuclear transport factor 2 family protein [Pseudomonadales bacterium]
MDEVARLKDKSDIQQTILNYAWGIDSRDWKLFRSIFADDLVMDFSSYSGKPASKITGDEWVAGCQAMLPGFDATQHVLTNFMIEVEEDEATAIVYMKAEHFIANVLGDNAHTLGGHYIHKLKRHGERWLIHATTLMVTWSRGNRQVYELARQRVAESGSNRHIS